MNLLKFKIIKQESGTEEKVEFITSFGGDSDGENQNGSHGVTFR